MAATTTRAASCETVQPGMLSDIATAMKTALVPDFTLKSATGETAHLEVLGFWSERNLIERIISKLKHFRRVATRYDKLAENFLAMVQLASMRLWLRVYESTT